MASNCNQLLDRTTGFPYTSLQAPDSFRLIRFLPTEDDAQDIHCSIEEFNRESPQTPEYVALSYAWGDANITKPITLNGHVTNITTNLHEALFHLRSARSNILLWADAISINQKDLGERCHQVSQMKAIYSGAREVIAWIGPAYTEVEQLGDATKSNDINNASKGRGKGGEVSKKQEMMTNKKWEKWGGYPAKIYGWLTNEELKNEEAISPELSSAVYYLETRPYWTRVWVIQEAVVAQKLSYMCGGSFIEPHYLAVYNSWRYRVDRFHPIMGAHKYGISHREHPPRLMGMMLNYKSYCTQNLARALYLSEATLSTDCRDLVYAILGLVREGAGQRIIPDYTVSPCMVYRAAIEAMFEDCKLHMGSISGVSEQLQNYFERHRDTHHEQNGVSNSDRENLDCELRHKMANLAGNVRHPWLIPKDFYPEPVANLLNKRLDRYRG